MAARGALKSKRVNSKYGTYHLAYILFQFQSAIMLPRINGKIVVIWTKETVLQKVVAMTAVLVMGYRGVIMMSSIQVKKL